MTSIKTCILLLFILTCTLLAQDKVRVIIDTVANKPMLVGVSNLEPLKNDTSFSNWFNVEYEEYHINKKDLKELSNYDSTYKITIVMGTWCSDSRREVPRFIKILDTLNYPVSKVKMIYVDREKKDLEGVVDSLSIKLVPTIILYGAEKELGRIEEAPEETLEKDLIRILNKK